MKNSGYLLHSMGVAVEAMGKSGSNLLKLNSQIAGALATLQAATIDRADSMKTKKRLGTNQIFDKDSFVPEAFKSNKLTQEEIITQAARTLVKAKRTAIKRKQS